MRRLRCILGRHRWFSYAARPLGKIQAGPAWRPLGEFDEYEMGELKTCMDCPAARMELKPLFSKKERAGLTVIKIPDHVPEDMC